MVNGATKSKIDLLQSFAIATSTFGFAGIAWKRTCRYMKEAKCTNAELPFRPESCREVPKSSLFWSWIAQL
jgi:hypothetical protein